jgi:hypothetical protein
MALGEDYFPSCLAWTFKFFPYEQNIGVVVIAVMDKDCQKSTRKKRKAPLQLGDLRREREGAAGAKGATGATTMPPPAAPVAAARKVPSPVKASEVEAARGAEMDGAGEASQELSVDDYLIEGVSMFDAHTGLAY